MPSIVILFAVLLWGISTSAGATVPTPPDPLVEQCDILTPQQETKAIPPEHFGTTNNLRRKEGAFLVAKGRPVVIYGKLLDDGCIPVSDARIEVWQGDHIVKKGKVVASDPNFVGSATAISNNLGQFTFLTVLPPASLTAKLHVQIIRENMPFFKTVLYIGDGEKTASAPPSLIAKPDTTASANNDYGTPYYITFTLEQDQDGQYRKY